MVEVVPKQSMARKYEGSGEFKDKSCTTIFTFYTREKVHGYPKWCKISCRAPLVAKDIPPTQQSPAPYPNAKDRQNNGLKSSKEAIVLHNFSSDLKTLNPKRLWRPPRIRQHHHSHADGKHHHGHADGKVAPSRVWGLGFRVLGFWGFGFWV